MNAFQHSEMRYMFSVKEAATILGVSIHTVYRLIQEGLLTTKKISKRKTMIPANEIQRYINEA